MEKITWPSICYSEYFQRLDLFLKDKLFLLYFTMLHYVQVINIYFAFYLLTNPMKKGSPHFSDHGF